MTEPPVKIINAYAPTAEALPEDKDTFYDALTDITGRHLQHKKTIILGDFNARVHKRVDESEEGIGMHTFAREDPRLNTQSEEAADNRHRFIGYLQAFELLALNTHYRKHIDKLDN